MVGIIQCSRIYCKRMSSKGLTSIGRYVEVRGRREAARGGAKKLHKTWTVRGGAWRRVAAHCGAWWCVAARWWRVAVSNLLQKLVAAREGV
jgi:hypothetical protein